ncbi:hypothetical protein LCGC14_0985750 [marine sediment metagenome]|uniref:Uncharacterized protein n=1 Tax=marine sediment metagenome TaxID=412755 RepID=A0A0F9N790_9ZZZZ
MKLKEVTQKDSSAAFARRGLTVDLNLSDVFDRVDADKVASRLDGKIVDTSWFLGEPERGAVAYEIWFPTEQDALHARKTLRRLQRGKPTFEIAGVSTWSVSFLRILEREGLLTLDENVNPGSGSPIRAGSMDLTPLSDKQKHQLAYHKGKYWRMSVNELKDALMRHKGDSRAISRINQVIKAKRKKREEVSKITQPIDSWRGGGGY